MYVDDPIRLPRPIRTPTIRSDPIRLPRPIRTPTIRSDPIRLDSSKQASKHEPCVWKDGWIDRSPDLPLPLPLLLLLAAACC
jgi:hypothetical protein